MRIPLSLILYFFSIATVYSQSSFDALGTQNTALANTSATIGNSWSGFHNPATLTSTASPTLGINFHNSYSLLNLNAGSLAISAPILSFPLFGFAGVHRFGDKVYNEHRLTMALALKIANTSIGFSFNSLQLAVLNYQTNYNFSLNIGALTKLSESLYIGTSISNITQAATLEEGPAIIPSVINIGIRYMPMDYFSFRLEAEKDLNHPFFIRSSFEYQVVKRWTIQSGIRSDNWQWYYGSSFQLNGLALNYAGSYHDTLGYSHGLSLVYTFETK